MYLVCNITTPEHWIARDMKVSELRRQGRVAFYLISSQYILTSYKSKPTQQTMWHTQKERQMQLITNQWQKRVILRIGCGFDKMDCRIMENLLDVLFQGQMGCYSFLAINCYRETACSFHHELLKLCNEVPGLIHPTNATDALLDLIHNELSIQIFLDTC